MKKVKSLREIGALVKKIHPQYHDVPDEEVGLVTLQEFPGYLNEIEVVDFDRRADKTKAELQKLDDSVDAGLGTIKSKWRNRKSKARGELRGNLNIERREILTGLELRGKTEMEQANQLAMPERFKRQVETERMEHDLKQKDHEITLMVHDQALEQKLPPQVYSLKLATEMADELEIKKKLKLDKQALKVRWREIEQDLKSGFIYQMQAYQHLELMRACIEGLYLQAIQAPDLRTQKMVEEHITFMEGEFREKQRLLQEAQRENPARSYEDTDSLRDPRQTVGRPGHKVEPPESGSGDRGGVHRKPRAKRRPLPPTGDNG